MFFNQNDLTSTEKLARFPVPFMIPILLSFLDPVKELLVNAQICVLPLILKILELESLVEVMLLDGFMVDFTHLKTYLDFSNPMVFELIACSKAPNL